MRFRLLTLLVVGPLAAAVSGMLLRTPPELGLEGFCPVTLVNKWEWLQGDPALTQVYQGVAFHFADTAAQQEFVANPEKFAPILGGADPVETVRNDRSVPGDRRWGLQFRGRVLLFSSEENLRLFAEYPGSYQALIRERELEQAKLRGGYSSLNFFGTLSTSSNAMRMAPAI